MAKVIIVEGKTDTAKLQQIFGPNIPTFETHGLGLDEATLAKIKHLHETVGIIIFTDPDGPGNKIRDRISTYLNDEVDHAFIAKNNIAANSKKIGIAEADDDAIKAALQNVLHFDGSHNISLSWNDFLNLDCFTKDNHNIICKELNLEPSINNKRLFKWLNLLSISAKNLEELLTKYK